MHGLTLLCHYLQLISYKIFAVLNFRGLRNFAFLRVLIFADARLIYNIKYMHNISVLKQYGLLWENSALNLHALCVGYRAEMAK